MSEEQRGDIGEFVTHIKGEADQLLVYASQLKMQADELSDIGERGATSATLCGIEQALAQIGQSAKQIGKDRHNAALVLGMDELIATQHKTLDQFEDVGKKAVETLMNVAKESGASMTVSCGDKSVTFGESEEEEYLEDPEEYTGNEYAAPEAMDQDEADAEAARLADEEAEMNAMSNEYEEYAEGEYD